MADDDIDIGFIEVEEWGRTEIAVYKKIALSSKALLAISMMERWGLVAGEPDGEDSAGRSKLNLMPVKQLVERACETADIAFKEFKERKWILDLPAPKITKKEPLTSRASKE